MQHDLILKKLRRLEAERPRVLDLFSGAGGLSLGMQAAGCEIVAALEAEPLRARTHAMNFHANQGDLALERHAKARDITTTDPFKFLQELGNEDGATAVDIIVGGPPCQAYARVGRAKLREVAAAPEAHLNDPRGQLWVHYLRYVIALQPVAVVIENVPDILRYGGDNVAELIAEALEFRGYSCRYTLLNAANFGVPQMRERWFLVAIHKAAQVTPVHPEATHYFNVPSGYLGTRGAALTMLSAGGESGPRYLAPLPTAHAGLASAVSCQDALSDLPSIPDSVKRAGKGRRQLADRLPYAMSPTTEYQRLMRTWPGFKSANDVSAHVIRYLPRDFETFGRMPEGSEYPQALATAETIFRERLERERKRHDVPEGGPAWKSLRDAIVPPYDDSKFPNKWVKLRADRPSRTLMAHLSHDSYSHIHYSATEARTISVREAARLQSFPDGFQFCGAMNSAFGQVGNAVPPLLAKAVGAQLVAQLRAAARAVPVVAPAAGLSQIAIAG